MIELLIQLGIGISVCILLMMSSHHFFNRMYKRNNGIHLKFFRSLLDVVIIVVLIYYALSLFSVTKDISKTLIQSGTLIIAIITFAAQQALGNVISGFSISIAKPYKTGDKVKVKSGSNIIAEGIITDVTIRHTIISTFEGHTDIIPNSVMDTAVIENTTYTENVGSFLEVEVGYDADVDKAKEIIKKLITEHELTIKEEQITVRLSRYTANGVILKAVIWTKTLDDNFAAAGDIREAILKEFKAADITIPYQTVTISNK